MLKLYAPNELSAAEIQSISFCKYAYLFQLVSLNLFIVMEFIFLTIFCQFQLLLAFQMNIFVFSVSEPTYIKHII